MKYLAKFRSLFFIAALVLVTQTHAESPYVCEEVLDGNKKACLGIHNPDGRKLEFQSFYVPGGVTVECIQTLGDWKSGGIDLIYCQGSPKSAPATGASCAEELPRYEAVCKVLDMGPDAKIEFKSTKIAGGYEVKCVATVGGDVDASRVQTVNCK